MPNSDKHVVDELLNKLHLLLEKQNKFYAEINNLRKEIEEIRQSGLESESSDKTTENKDVAEEIVQKIQKPKTSNIPISPKKSILQRLEITDNIEKFIGENLINKIGILITIIGVGIGVKYAINHELISPLARIILGYLMGLGLLGFAYKLKEKYHNFSAVLLSGAVAILYFITFFTYAYYHLIPQNLAFVLMLFFTVFTVFSALHYNQAVIAIIGLVGAYATPFLLSSNSGNYFFLFAYILMVNVGILIISFKKNWKSLYYIAFVFTWLIFFKWYDNQYQTEIHFYDAFGFLLLYFIVFYLTFLSYKLIKKEQFNKMDISILLANSFIFFGLGYDMIANNKPIDNLLGLFALFNALIHFSVSFSIYKKGLGNKSLFYFISGLVLVFITIAIPIQLDGNWVTLLWIGEATLLFWVGRSKKIPIYEKLTYPLLFIAFISLIHDWNTSYNNYYSIENSELRLSPIFNIQFLSSVVFIGALAGLNFIKIKFESVIETWKSFYKISSYLIPVLLVVVLYFSFRLEIANYWNQLYTDSKIASLPENDYMDYTKNYDLITFKNIWIANYSLFFLAIFTYLGKKIFNIKSVIILILSGLALFNYLTETLLGLSQLRESYLSKSLSEVYHIGSYHLWIRYISYLFVALLIGSIYQSILKQTNKPTHKKSFEIVLYTILIWISSSELINWMDIAASSQPYKFGLSILWGCIALGGIAYGIWKHKKHLRIAAIILFTVTLIKLFIYDITNLNTVAKTIAFVSLGILLLIISFLYNKYKNIINDEN